MIKIKFDLEPVPSPRINKGDTYLMKKHQRGHILTPVEEQRYRMLERYYNNKKALVVMANQLKFELPDANWHVMFYKPMPSSWSKTKRKKMRFTPCQVMPDTDNYLKAFKDALRKQDNMVWDERSSKLWGETGYIEVVTEIPSISKILKFIKEKYGNEAYNEILTLQ